MSQFKVAGRQGSSHIPSGGPPVWCILAFKEEAQSHEDENCALHEIFQSRS